MSELRLAHWQIEDDRVKLVYEDDSVVYVMKKDFDRAFGCIISITKDEVIRDFAVN